MQELQACGLLHLPIKSILDFNIRFLTAVFIGVRINWNHCSIKNIDKF